MGTTGLYIFIYKCKCYVFYNQLDSYPESLGQILVTMIKTENYKKWGEIILDKIDNKNYKIRKLTYESNNDKYIEITDEKNNTNYKDIMEDNEWIKNIFSYDGKSFIYLKWNFKDLIKDCEITKGMIKTFCPSLETSSFVTSFDINEKTYINKILELNCGDWIYIMDLDIQEFKIPLHDINQEPNILTFDLNNIPFDWKEKIKIELEKK